MDRCAQTRQKRISGYVNEGWTSSANDSKELYYIYSFLTQLCYKWCLAGGSGIVPDICERQFFLDLQRFQPLVSKETENIRNLAEKYEMGLS